MNKNSTYNVNEEALRQRLNEFELSFDELSWTELEKRLDEVKVLNPISVSMGRFNPKLLAIPAVLLIGGLIFYLNIDKLRSENNPSVSTALPVSTKTELSVNEEPNPKTEIKTSQTAKDSVKPAEIKVAEVQAKSEPVVKPEIKPEVAATETKVEPKAGTPGIETVSADQTTKKKKKRRRNRETDVYESVRNASMSQSDESVEVPSN